MKTLETLTAELDAKRARVRLAADAQIALYVLDGAWPWRTAMTWSTNANCPTKGAAELADRYMAKAALQMEASIRATAVEMAKADLAAAAELQAGE